MSDLTTAALVCSGAVVLSYVRVMYRRAKADCYVREPYLDYLTAASHTRLRLDVLCDHVHLPSRDEVVGPVDKNVDSGPRLWPMAYTRPMRNSIDNT